MTATKGLAGLMRTHHCGELRSSDIGKTVTICGWVNKYRNLGSLHFIDVRDKFGVTQLGFVNFNRQFIKDYIADRLTGEVKELNTRLTLQADNFNLGPKLGSLPY